MLYLLSDNLKDYIWVEVIFRHNRNLHGTDHGTYARTQTVRQLIVSPVVTLFIYGIFTALYFRRNISGVSRIKPHHVTAGINFGLQTYKNK